ncbi:MAG: hypothetical protein HC855_07030 [Rhizobiales bacterium]|nr:hypothetical protein [Hyphomicrobiales bacterium]
MKNLVIAGAMLAALSAATVAAEGNKPDEMRAKYYDMQMQMVDEEMKFMQSRMKHLTAFQRHLMDMKMNESKSFGGN